LFIFSVISLKDPGVLLVGTFIFMIQSVIIGKSYLVERNN